MNNAAVSGIYPAPSLPDWVISGESICRAVEIHPGTPAGPLPGGIPFVPNVAYGDWLPGGVVTPPDALPPIGFGVATGPVVGLPGIAFGETPFGDCATTLGPRKGLGVPVPLPGIPDEMLLR